MDEDPSSALAILDDGVWRGMDTVDTVNLVHSYNLPPEQEQALLDEIRSYLAPGGTAYISVRADIDRAGPTSRGYQRPVRLDAPVLGRPSEALIYEVRG